MALEIGNVLSLFDGMSCGQIALNKLGIQYGKYYASEIDKHAMQITQSNYPNTIQLGSVVDVKAEDLPKIDLLFGGSPCQSFSLAGRGEGFDGRSSLFWEYVRVLNEVKPKYFLLENVVMKKEWRDIITDALGVQPIMINSRLVSAQNRPRLYWTNIPGIGIPEDKHLIPDDVLDVQYTYDYPCKDYLELHFGNKRRKDYIPFGTAKTGCLTASMYKVNISSFIKHKDGRLHRLTPTDCEILQTVPIGYTVGVSNTERYRMLGNGWTVDVIAHIFSFIFDQNGSLQEPIKRRTIKYSQGKLF